MKPIEARKQLLLAESDLNRVQLLQEWSGLKGEVQRMTHQIRTVGSLVSLTAALMAAFSAWQQGASGPDERKNKTSWIATLLSSARTGASLWAMLKAFFR